MRIIQYIKCDNTFVVLTVPLTPELRIKLALRILRAISVDHRLPDAGDVRALQSLPGARSGMSLDELACQVIVEEAQRMRIAAEQSASDAIARCATEALLDCA
jgi:hypothetical protein